MFLAVNLTIIEKSSVGLWFGERRGALAWPFWQGGSSGHPTAAWALCLLPSECGALAGVGSSGKGLCRV